eukprot:5015945-Amphidinium_carterae.1
MLKSELDCYAALLKLSCMQLFLIGWYIPNLECTMSVDFANRELPASGRTRHVHSLQFPRPNAANVQLQSEQ